MAGGKLVHYVEDLGVIARSEMTSTPRGYSEVALLPAADLRHQSRLRAQGALRRQPELDVDRRYAAR